MIRESWSVRWTEQRFQIHRWLGNGVHCECCIMYHEFSGSRVVRTRIYMPYPRAPFSCSGELQHHNGFPWSRRRTWAARATRRGRKKRERSKDRDDIKSSDKKQKRRNNSEGQDGRPSRSLQRCRSVADLRGDVRKCLPDVCQVNENLRVRKGSLQVSDFLSDLRTGSSSLCFLKLLNARLERTTELADDA